MARPRNRKRQQIPELSQSNPPPKKAKLKRESNFSPVFWGNLSKIWLTPCALRELNRRNSAYTLPILPEVYPTDLARFARHGGPDLCHLRGYSEPKKDMSSNPSSTSRSRPTNSTAATSVTSKARKSSAYNDNFEQHLIDYNIYPEGYEHPESRSTPEPNNSNQTHQELLAFRASLSPSRFPESVFRDFKRKNRTKSEGSIMRNVIPLIASDSNTPNESNIQFTNLISLTDESTVKAVPDYFDGAKASDLHSVVRRELNELVIPTKHANVPIIPNFFLEAKGPSGSVSVAEKLACYDGAHGARALHALQNYKLAEPTYDGNAYTYSSTYHDGTLKLYAHHVTAPTVAEERPEYHMTQIDGWQMTGSIDTFRRGATAFRNARDSAKQHRDSFIQAANATAEDAVERHEAASNHPEMPEMQRSEDRSAHTGWKDAEETLQQ
ncbi:uncharacterized protein G6M90_00g068160 [Metarhizium brunneum]|uniref:DUF7924 domain-containing protein n=1 Tax=Metarhizium brunneum TaxID=500148 RepID=A0A7D5YVY1_9HYPO